MTPRRDKLSLTPLELLSWAASESSVEWEIFPAKLDGENKTSSNNSKTREEKEPRNGISKESNKLTPSEKHSTKNKLPKLEINWLNSDIDLYTYLNIFLSDILSILSIESIDHLLVNVGSICNFLLLLQLFKQFQQYKPNKNGKVKIINKSLCIF